ncbi:MAG: STAS domain-containing protein [Bacteroidetes bacterium]|nr:STAS domain-containing protein [Bacteroidota bacterium]
MEIFKQKQGDSLLISVEGELDASSSIDMDKAIEATINEGIYKLLINCEKLSYISSAGVGVFVSYVEDIKNKNGKIVFYKMQANVLSVLQILGLDKILSIAETEEEAKLILNEG